jgi:hypothetical protein
VVEELEAPFAEFVSGELPSDESAAASTGRAIPMPKATANAPTRPTNRP